MLSSYDDSPSIIGDKRTMLTADRLREVIEYTPESGEFIWKKKIGARSVIGVRAGNFRKDGYLAIQIDGTKYKGHRLAWLWVTGRWPEEEIDHRNGSHGDNRWENLRSATHFVNAQNQRIARRDNVCGFLGVCKSGENFRAYINENGKKKHLGSFQTPQLAHAAYLKAKRALHPGCTI